MGTVPFIWPLLQTKKGLIIGSWGKTQGKSNILQPKSDLKSKNIGRTLQL